MGQSGSRDGGGDGDRNESCGRTFAFRMTLQLGPIQMTRMNFSRLDSLSFAYWTRTYPYDALESSSCSRSSARPPDPVAVSFSLSERSDCVRGCPSCADFQHLQHPEQGGVDQRRRSCEHQGDRGAAPDIAATKARAAHLVVEQKPVRVRLVRADVLVRCTCTAVTGGPLAGCASGRGSPSSIWGSERSAMAWRGRRRKQRRTRRRTGGNEGQTEVVGAVVVLSRSLAVFTDIDPYSSASPGRCVELPVHYIPIRTDRK